MPVLITPRRNAVDADALRAKFLRHARHQYGNASLGRPIVRVPGPLSLLVYRKDADDLAGGARAPGQYASAQDFAKRLTAGRPDGFTHDLRGGLARGDVVDRHRSADGGGLNRLASFGRAHSALQSLFQLRLVHPGAAFHGAFRRLVAKLSQRAPTRTLMRSQTVAPTCRHVVIRRGARLLGLAMLCPHGTDTHVGEARRDPFDIM